MSEPLPCPFCGHTGLSFEDGSTHRWGIAACDGCGATTGEVRRNYPDDGKWHAEATKEWNRRAQPAQAVPLLTAEELMHIAISIDQQEGYLRGTTNWAVAIGRAVEQAVRAKMGVAVPSDVVCDKDPQGCWNVRCQLGKVCKNAAAHGLVGKEGA